MSEPATNGKHHKEAVKLAVKALNEALQNAAEAKLTIRVRVTEGTSEAPPRVVAIHEETL